MLKFIKVARVLKTHGYKGELIIKKDSGILNSVFEECLEEGNAVFIERDGIPVPFFITENSLYFIDDDTARMMIDEVNNVEQARDFIGEEVYFTGDCLNQPEKINKSPLFWKNFSVIDDQLGFLGKLIDFNEDITQNPLLVVENNEKQLLIPYNEAFIKEISIEKQELITQLPEGFSELYF